MEDLRDHGGDTVLLNEIEAGGVLLYDDENVTFGMTDLPGLDLLDHTDSATENNALLNQTSDDPWMPHNPIGLTFVEEKQSNSRDDEDEESNSKEEEGLAFIGCESQNCTYSYTKISPYNSSDKSSIFNSADSLEKGTINSPKVKPAPSTQELTLRSAMPQVACSTNYKTSSVVLGQTDDTSSTAKVSKEYHEVKDYKFAHQNKASSKQVKVSNMNTLHVLKSSCGDLEALADGLKAGHSKQIPVIVKTKQISVKDKKTNHLDVKEEPSKLSLHSKKAVIPKRFISFPSMSSVEEDSDVVEKPLEGPSSRWPSQPRSYKGARSRESAQARKCVRKFHLQADTDGETSGMGSSVDEPVESSTESASETTAPPTAFLQPRPSASRVPVTSTTTVKKRRGGWPKGRKRKPELPGAKPPKAPLTAYVLFLNERRKYYKQIRPDLTFGEVTKLLGSEWSAKTADQKAAYVSRSEQDKRRYRNELQAYRQSHDYQLLLRKKRMKNFVRRSGGTTEESSDFTDEVDDDESEELYCRICDQWFTSLHNKREHLYGRQHLQAITGEYQRERLEEEAREEAATVPVDNPNECSSCGTKIVSGADSKSVDLCTGCCDRKMCPRQPAPCHDEEEDHDGDEEDEEEEEDEDDDEEEDDSKEEVEEVEQITEIPTMTDAIEGIMNKMLEREREIKQLKKSLQESQQQHQHLSKVLLQLKEKEKLHIQGFGSMEKEKNNLLSQADRLWMVPALFGITPLDIVNLPHTQNQEDKDKT
ncbi:uncharacterized protein LOC143040040 isoform X2 [Oratosquilla oratoria]|uniref:uncharacterized protein LOC143040040 isoform X2 n=1 Tax=Oratosquilla oratoria TaxID=337810 RepID=UPI003F759389